jgi:hypothetical protein
MYFPCHYRSAIFGFPLFIVVAQNFTREKQTISMMEQEKFVGTAAQ